MTRLHTPRLQLSEFSAADDASILALLNTPGFLTYIADRGVRTLEDARSYLAAGPCASYVANGFGLWKVSLTGTGETIGMCGLIRRDTLPCPDLGYAFLPAFVGFGYASEAGAAVMRHAFTTLALPQVLAIVEPANAASIHVLAKLGFRYQDTREVGGKRLQVHEARP